MTLTSVYIDLRYNAIAPAITDLRYPPSTFNGDRCQQLNFLYRCLITGINPTSTVTAVLQNVKHEIQQRP